MLRWPPYVVRGTARYIRCSFLHDGENLRQFSCIAPKKVALIQRKRELHHASTNNVEELQRIITLSDELIHRSPSIPFNKVKIVSVERCLRFLASYLADLQKGAIRPLHTQNGIINEDRVKTIANLLWERIQLDSQNRFDSIISGRVYSYMIDILARSGLALEAGQILNQMIAWTQSHPMTLRHHDKRDEFNSLHSALFSTVINAHAKMQTTSASALQERRRDTNSSFGKSGLEQAEALLKYQLQLYQEWNKPLKIKPNIICFTAVLDAIARRGDGPKAQALLDDLLHHDIRATTTTFNVAIAAWARASGHESTKLIQVVDRLPAKMAEQILLTMEERSQGHARPDVVSFSTVIKAWADCHIQPYGVQRAEEILQNMELGPILPNITCYNTVINGYACHGDSQSAERLLYHLVSVSSSKRSDPISPDIFTFNTVLKAISRSVYDKSKQQDRCGAGQRAESILHSLENLEQTGVVQADVITYNTVLRTLCNIRNDPTSLDKALFLLHRMEEKGIQDRISYNTVLAAYANNVEDALRYSSKARTLHNSPHFSSDLMTLAEKAESLMVRMETIDALPDEVSYNTLIKIWSKMGLTDRAESVFQKMKQRGSKSSPTPMTYVSLLDAYAHSISTHAHGKNIQATVERAKSLLGEMNSVFKRTPTIAYNAYLNILSKTHNMMEAESVLESMGNNADISSRPDVLSYCTLINGWARNSRNDKAQKAHCILMRLLSRHANGDTPGINNGSVEKVRNAYNMTIMACAFTGKHAPLDNRVKAMGIAHEILLSMRTSKWFHPTLLTYELLFQGYSVWLSDVTPDDQKSQIPFDTLQYCIEDGLVSNIVVERFINVTSQDFRKSVYYKGFSLGRFDEIPSEWSRNIRRFA